MRDVQDSPTDITDDVEFFVELAAQGLSVGFVRVALASGKFPVARQMGAVRAQGEKELVVPLDDRGNDDDRFKLQGFRVTPNLGT